MTNNKNNYEEIFANIAQSGQNWFNQLLDKNKSNDYNNLPIINMYKNFFANAQSYIGSQQSFYQAQMNLWQDCFNKNNAQNNQNTDKRFSAVEWNNNPFFAYLKDSYLGMSNYLVDFVSKSNMDDETKLRMKFFINQYLDAISPTNFALTNPDVIKTVIETNGESLVAGMQRMVEDMNNGYISMTDESLFEVGRNLATTKGGVIYRNDLMELIQYTPSSASVYQTPLLIVPPCINKYYILDLQQENSLVKYLVDQGFNVFLISWKSADKNIRDYKWEEYINIGVIPAIETVREITKQNKINTLGYCIGGILLTTACLVLNSKKLDYINSMAHMTTMLDHQQPGDIKFFLDRDLLQLKDAQKNGGGIMSGRVISQTFSALRSNELIWNYWVNNYLLGKKPKPFDILFWNSDAVDLPVLMHSFFLNNFYVQNQLIKGTMVIDNITMDLSKIDFPCYVFAAQKDHIVPWESAYKTTQYIKKNIRFVLGASGHTAGVVNPVSSDKKNYWINDKLGASSSDWFNHAQEMPGSWWKDYSAWLAKLSKDKIKASSKLGNNHHTVICDAPGEYVKAKALSILEAEVI